MGEWLSGCSPNFLSTQLMVIFITFAQNLIFIDFWVENVSFWLVFCLNNNIFLIPFPLQNGRISSGSNLTKRTLLFSLSLRVIQPVVPMIKHSLVLAVCLGLLYSPSLFGQVGFSLPTYTNTSTGQNLDFPVSVVHFDSVFSIQFVIQWNPDVLEFKGIEHLVNPLAIVDSSCFNLSEVSEGFIRFRWYSSSYKTLQNTTAVFTLKMQVVGLNGTSSPISFTELPPVTYFEIVRGVNNQFFFLNTALLTNGSVSVGIVGNEEPGMSTAIKVFPNPFSSTATLTFDMPRAGNVLWRITDALGRIVQEESFEAQQGRNEVLINQAALFHNGVYYIQLLTDQQRIVHPVIFNGGK